MANFKEKPQVSFLDACKLAVQKSFIFKGRIRRSEYWWAILGIFIANILLTWIPFIGNLISLYLTIVSLSLAFRRLHDTNHSGWIAGANILLCIGGVIIIFTGAVVGGFSFADLSDDPTALSSSISDALMGASFGYIIIGLLMILASAIIQIVMIVLCCFDSDFQANKYGESPKYIIEEQQ